MQEMNLTNHFLIAMPTMNDPNFAGVVIYICEHNDQGALGIIINRPSKLHLDEVLDQMEIRYVNREVSSVSVLNGGPIHPERGFVIHPPFGEWQSSFATSDEIMVTTSRDILQAIADAKGPDNIVISLGYAGWTAGQLEAELAKNYWLSCPADLKILFEVPYRDRWNASYGLLGINPQTLSGFAGHA